MNEHIQRQRERIARGPRVVDELTEAHLWQSHGTVLWRAQSFRGTPSFYPVYRYEDLYSYSPLVLILSKNRFRLDRELAKSCARRHFRFLSGRGVLDRDIARIGAPLRPTNDLSTPQDYIRAIVEALRADVASAEAHHPNLTNVVLCGGKDSLNLLLLPWKNPTLVASAAPNFELVRQFVTDNGLDFQVVELTDAEDADVLASEALENGCRNNLEHCRWGVDLRRLAQAHRRQVIFWKGQLGDLYMTPKWKAVSDSFVELTRWGRQAYAAHDALLPASLRRAINGRWLEPRFREICWTRSAMWQGAHMSLLRQVADCLVLSAYHGPAMTRVLTRVNLTHAVPFDLRDEVGRQLLGRPVRYPERNPSPPPSRTRRGRSGPAPFIALLRRAGVTCET